MTYTCRVWNTVNGDSETWERQSSIRASRALHFYSMHIFSDGKSSNSLCIGKSCLFFMSHWPCCIRLVYCFSYDSPFDRYRQKPYMSLDWQNLFDKNLVIIALLAFSYFKKHLHLQDLSNRFTYANPTRNQQRNYGKETGGKSPGKNPPRAQQQTLQRVRPPATNG